MSPGGRSERMCDLRDVIARIEGNGAFAPTFGRTDAPRKVTLGHAENGLALDRLLRGGLLRGTLNEVVADSAGDAGAASGFALALAMRFATETRADAPLVWVMEDAARAEGGTPYAPGLAAHGLDPARLLVVRVKTGTDALWAAEEALKCRAVAAVVVDLWRTKTYDLVASRRLLLAAAAGGTPGILVPAGSPGGAISSAAQARFTVAAAPGPHVLWPHVSWPNVTAANARPIPGRAAWAVRLARIRAGPAGAAAGFDCEKVWPLVWDHQEACLCDALPLPPPALPRDRPSSAALEGNPPGRERAA